MQYINTTPCTAQLEDGMKTEPQKNIHFISFIYNLWTNTRWHKFCPDTTFSALSKSNAEAKIIINFSILIETTHHCSKHTVLLLQYWIQNK